MAFSISSIAVVLSILSTVSTQWQNVTANGCPDYTTYSQQIHEPLSNGPVPLSNARPAEQCRSYVSLGVEEFIQNITSRMADPDLARLFENCFASCLDTVIRWKGNAATGEELCFVITGDIDAMWLRDSAQSLHPYQSLITTNNDISSLFRGTINLQSRYITNAPYCNAFQPPVESGLPPQASGFRGDITPVVNNQTIWTPCQFELDSLAGFFQLSYDYWKATGNASFFQQPSWLSAVDSVLQTMDSMMVPSYNPATGAPNEHQPYLFVSDEPGWGSLVNSGAGEPFNTGTGLVHTPFRPSDDPTIFTLHIPSNAMMSVQLRKISSIIQATSDNITLASVLYNAGTSIENAIYRHGVTTHPEYGMVFAYEVDGYGSYNLMDDSNIPSLLALPMLGFISQTDRIYQNTRNMLLNRHSNRYYATGPVLSGIGGPHKGPKYAWPMALCAQIQTSSNRTEILELLDSLKTSTDGVGLMHEGINTYNQSDYTRSWFVWANGLFGQTILDVAERFPDLLVS